MQEKHLFEYAVIRVMPRVERGEFLNVGVILYCPGLNFLRAEFELDGNRLRALVCDLDVSEIEEHLKALGEICTGGNGSGPIGKLSAGERFRWLTAPRSTVVQTSAVHTGLLIEAGKTLDGLMEKLVHCK